MYLLRPEVEFLHCKSLAFCHKLEVQAQVSKRCKNVQGFQPAEIPRLLRFSIFLNLHRGSGLQTDI